MRDQPDARATAGGLGALLLWSATFALARSLSEQLGPVTAGAAAYLVGGGFCLLRLATAPRPLARLRELPARYVWGCGGLFVAYTAAIYLAVGLARDRTQLLVVALINYLWPALTIVLSLPLLGRRAGPGLFPGTLLAVAGVFLVMTGGDRISWQSIRANLQSNPAPMALALAAAFAWALYSNLTRRWTRPGTGGAVEWFIPATGLALLALRSGVTEATNWSFRAAMETAALAAITTLAYALWDVAMRRGNLLLVAACSYATPALSTAFSCFYLRVAPGPGVWTGCALLVLGSVLSWRSVAARQLTNPRSSRALARHTRHVPP